MTSLSLFPRALALSAYSAVSGSRMTLCLAISCSALFACRSPPLLSLCLTVLPLEAGMGQCESAWVSTPQKTGPRAPGADSFCMSRSVLSVLAWTGQTAH